MPDFTFPDGDRLIRFGPGVLAEMPTLLAQRGFRGYALLTTERAVGAAPDLAGEASTVLTVPVGPIPDAAAAVRERVGGRPLVALGGGRVIDSAKAIAAADGLACAAIPTTLSGAPFTPFHRMPAGFEGFRLVRPSLVVADPELMASQPLAGLAASAMNALAHAAESLYAPMANPVTGMAALRSAGLLATGLRGRDPVRGSLALGAFLAGYAVGIAGFAVHHAVCQTIVRVLGTGHAETNAVMLPRSVAFVAERAPLEIGLLATALGDESGDPVAAADLIAPLAARAGPTTLGDLGVGPDQLDRVAEAIVQHPALANTPPSGVSRPQLLRLLESAL